MSASKKRSIVLNRVSWNCWRSCLPSKISAHRKDKKSFSVPLVPDNTELGDDNSALRHLSSDILSEPTLANTSVNRDCDDNDLVFNEPGSSDDTAAEWVRQVDHNVASTAIRDAGAQVDDVTDSLPTRGDSDVTFDESQDNYIPLDQCFSGESHHQLSASSSLSTTQQAEVHAPSSKADAGCLNTPTAEILTTSSAAPIDSFLLDVVPPSPCRGAVQLKNASSSDYGSLRKPQIHRQLQLVGNEPDIEAAQPQRPPVASKLSPRVNIEARGTEPAVANAPVSSAPSPASSVFQSPPPLHKRTLQVVRSSESAKIEPAATSPYYNHQQQQRNLNETLSPSDNTDDDDDDDDEDDNPAFAFLQSPAPSAPSRRVQPVGTGDKLPLDEPPDGGPSLVRRCGDHRPLNHVGGAPVPDRSLLSDYVHQDKGPVCLHRQTSVAPPDDRYENLASSTSSQMPTSATGDVIVQTVPRQLSVSSSTLNLSPPAPHISNSRQIRHHRYINASTVSFDPSKKGNLRVILPPVAGSGDCRAVQSRAMAHCPGPVSHTARTLPGNVGRTTPSSDKLRYYNADVVPPQTSYNNQGQHLSLIDSVNGRHSSSLDKPRAHKSSRAIPSSVPLPTRRYNAFEELSSSTDDDDTRSGQSGYSSASSLDRPIAPPARLAHQSNVVNYAILNLVEDTETLREPSISYRKTSTASLQRHVPPSRAHNGGGVSSMFASSTASDADDKSTVYNVIDWERTQVLNEMRKQLETDRHLTTNSVGSGQK